MLKKAQELTKAFAPWVTTMVILISILNNNAKEIELA